MVVELYSVKIKVSIWGTWTASDKKTQALTFIRTHTLHVWAHTLHVWSHSHFISEHILHIWTHTLHIWTHNLHIWTHTLHVWTQTPYLWTHTSFLNTHTLYLNTHTHHVWAHSWCTKLWFDYPTIFRILESNLNQSQLYPADSRHTLSTLPGHTQYTHSKLLVHSQCTPSIFPSCSQHTDTIVQDHSRFDFILLILHFMKVNICRGNTSRLALWLTVHQRSVSTAWGCFKMPLMQVSIP